MIVNRCPFQALRADPTGLGGKSYPNVNLAIVELEFHPLDSPRITDAQDLLVKGPVVHLCLLGKRVWRRLPGPRRGQNPIKSPTRNPEEAKKLSELLGIDLENPESGESDESS